MNATRLLLLAAGLAVAALAQPSAPPPQPGPSLQRLQIRHGDWTYATEFLETPVWTAGKITGTASTRPTLDGFGAETIYLEPTAAGPRQRTETNWLDPKTNDISYVLLGNDGRVEQGTCVFTGSTWTWQGVFPSGGRYWKVRGKGTFADDRNSFTQTGEVSPDGSMWIPAFTRTATRATTPSRPDAATIRRDVIQTVHGMFAAKERLDAAAAWACHADVPGYLWTDIDGAIHPFESTRQAWADFLSGCSQLSYTTKREEVEVFGNDTALYLWHGAADLTAKDGKSTHHDSWTACYLCRRIDGVWKIVGGQESSAPPPPAPEIPLLATPPPAQPEPPPVPAPEAPPMAVPTAQPAPPPTILPAALPENPPAAMPELLPSAPPVAPAAPMVSAEPPTTAAASVEEPSAPPSPPSADAPALP